MRETWAAVSPTGRKLLLTIAACAAASLTLTLITYAIIPAQRYLEVNPLAAAYLSISPLALVAMKLVAVPLCLFGLARAWPHVPRLMHLCTWGLAIFCPADVAWDALQLTLLLVWPPPGALTRARAIVNGAASTRSPAARHVQCPNMRGPRLSNSC